MTDAFFLSFYFNCNFAASTTEDPLDFPSQSIHNILLGSRPPKTTCIKYQRVAFSLCKWNSAGELIDYSVTMISLRCLKEIRAKLIKSLQ